MRPEPLVAHKKAIPAIPLITPAEEISPGFIGGGQEDDNESENENRGNTIELVRAERKLER